MRMSWTLKANLWLLLLLLSFGNCHAEQGAPLIFFVKEMRPFGYFDSNGKPIGAGVDAAEAISKIIKRPISVKVVPHARIIHNFKYEDYSASENINMDFTFNIDSQNISNSIPVVPFYQFEVLLVGRKGLDVDNYAKLRDIKIAKIRGARYTSQLHHQQNNIKTVEVNDYQQALQLFAKGRVDAIIGTQFPIIQAAKNAKIDYALLNNFVVIDHTRLWIYASTSSKNLDLIPAIKAAVQTLIKDGSIQAIVEKYSPSL